MNPVILQKYNFRITRKAVISELNNEIENSDKDIKINSTSIESSSQSIYKSMIHAFIRLKV